MVVTIVGRHRVSKLHSLLYGFIPCYSSGLVTILSCLRFSASGISLKFSFVETRRPDFFSRSRRALTYPRQPELERFGFGRGNGLDQAQELFRVGNVGKPLFAISCGHFQTVTICHGFISFLFQTLFQLPTISARVCAFSKNRYNINNGKVPFLLFLTPCRTDLL